MLIKVHLRKITILLIILIFFGCEDNGSEKPDDQLHHISGTGNVIIHFDHKVDGQDVVMNEMRYQNEAGNKYSVLTLKYIISDVTFHARDGSVYEIDTFFYVDIADTASIAQAVLHVPNGNYSHISFTFGLDADKNITGGLPNTQVLNNFEWPVPMGGGYHYMKFEGRFEKNDGSTSNFNTHTGRLKTSDGELHENFFIVTFPISLITIKDDLWEIQLQMNLNSWYSTPNTYDIESYGPAIMGNQEAQQILKENGHDVFLTGSITKISDYE